MAPHVRIIVVGNRPLGMTALHRKMNQVTTHDGALRLRLHTHGDMPRGMPMGGLQPHRIIKGEVGVHQLGLPGFQNWENALLKRDAVVSLAMFHLGTGKYVLGIGKRRHPSTVKQLRVPPNMIESKLAEAR